MILVDFDTVISDISTIIKRGQIYIQNNPDKLIRDYIAAHINEQEPISEGIKKVWELQKKCYKIVFITSRSEGLRFETAQFLNKWGLEGELYMHDLGSFGVEEKSWLIALIEDKGFKVVGLLDSSVDASEILQKNSQLKKI